MTLVHDNLFHIGVKDDKTGLTVIVGLDLVKYIHVDDNYLEIYTSDGRQYLKKCPLTTFIDNLPAIYRYTFLRFGRSDCLHKGLVVAYSSDAFQFNEELVNLLHYNARLRLKDVSPGDPGRSSLQYLEII
jgi:hypothetical protein